MRGTMKVTGPQRRGRKVQIWLPPQCYMRLCTLAGKNTLTRTIVELIESAQKSGSTHLARSKKPFKV